MTIVLAKLLAKCTGVTHLLEYFEDIIKARRDEEHLYLLPPLIDRNKNMQQVDINLPHLLLDKVKSILDAFKKSVSNKCPGFMSR